MLLVLEDELFIKPKKKKKLYWKLHVRKEQKQLSVDFKLEDKFAKSSFVILHVTYLALVPKRRFYYPGPDFYVPMHW